MGSTRKRTASVGCRAIIPTIASQGGVRYHPWNANAGCARARQDAIYGCPVGSSRNPADAGNRIRSNSKLGHYHLGGYLASLSSCPIASLLAQKLPCSQIFSVIFSLFPIDREFDAKLSRHRCFSPCGANGMPAKTGFPCKCP